MSGEQDEARSKPDDSIVRRLAVEAGITEAQARELIAVLGAYSWTSLLREARILNGKQ